ncbi:MAG: bifunctional pyr operon transcriptional regulator/uracil phosphoribosyltransferase PyrR [Saprospirales bacterium]|nr:bifunctional pyr operon transcriptional regulator/uracil phosphoribosyltransferase PyrR [Saprospirales bacterium]MBK8492049.1 bifunctional pyr operon transcriptional regulator/uracil phosphoribosyltransferase PyrR [Saprospirales bacterium]
MDKGRIILNQEQFQLTIERLCQQLIEEFQFFEKTCLIGIQPRGVLLASRLHQRLLSILNIPSIEYGILDITFYRDDFRIRAKPLKASVTDMPFLVEGKNVLLVDDVLYSGRTVQAALTALQHYGRPNRVELVAMVDRRFNRHLPIQPDFTGLRVDALDEAYVKVEWKEKEQEDRILLFAKKEDSELP